MGEIVILEWSQIEALIEPLDLVGEMEKAFVAYSEGRAVIPPVGELVFEDPPGDVHIKYGYLTGGELYVIKVASGFYRNRELGLASSQGMMLLFRQATGEPAAILLDEGRLTDLRTAAAGAVAARYLAPRTPERIGILGTGTQARRQLEQLARVTSCRRVLAYGRSKNRLEDYCLEMQSAGFEVEDVHSPGEIASRCRLIVTTTPATEPLLQASDIRPGTHITAVGSDTSDKQELDPAILAKADQVVADSFSQCRTRGEIHHALQAGLIDAEKITELGAVVAGRAPGRRSEDEITVADLTGVAVQDLQIATAVYRAFVHGSPQSRL